MICLVHPQKSTLRASQSFVAFCQLGRSSTDETPAETSDTSQANSKGHARSAVLCPRDCPMSSSTHALLFLSLFSLYVSICLVFQGSAGSDCRETGRVPGRDAPRHTLVLEFGKVGCFSGVCGFSLRDQYAAFAVLRTV